MSSFTAKTLSIEDVIGVLDKQTLAPRHDRMAHAPRPPQTGWEIPCDNVTVDLR